MSPPSTQKAGVVPKAGQPVEITSRPVPAVGPQDVLIRITSAAINPVDWKIQDGLFPYCSLPNVLGSDAAGVVAAVGSDVSTLTTGDRVFFQGKIGETDMSTFQQYCVCPASLVGRIPDNVGEDEAGGVSLASVAAWTMLSSDGGLGFRPAPWEDNGHATGSGKSIIVLGGSSSVGQYSIQLARLAGFNVVANSSAAHLGMVGKLGASAALDRKTAAAGDYVEALGGKPLAGILDGISAEDTQLLAADIYLAASAAGMVAEGLPKGPAVGLVLGPNAAAAERAKGVSPAPVQLRPILGIGHSPDLRPLAEGFYKACGGEGGWMARGLFVPNSVQVVEGGLAGLQEALDLNKKGLSGKKAVIRPHETR